MRGDLEVVSTRFGRNLAEAREWAGLTQWELAEQASVRLFEVGKMERGTRCPRLDMVIRLADALELQVRDLLYEIE